MSRLKDAEPILQAAKQWKQRCLLDGGSVFSDDLLWTLDNFKVLNHHYVESLDEGEDQFDVKLKRQLEPVPPDAKRLWAEMAWVYALYPLQITATKKRSQILTYWGWSGDELEQSHDALTDAVLAGVGSGGTAYNTHKWREFRLFVTMMADWFGFGKAERASMLANPWGFARWLEGQEYVSGCMLRHVVLFLLFPDSFEPITTVSYKQQIVKALHPGEPAVDFSDRIALDRAVLDVRRELEGEFPDLEVNFYRSPIKERWQAPKTVPQPDPKEADETGVAVDTAEAWFRAEFPDSKRVWWLSVGTGGRFWSDFVNEDIAVLSHGDLGDLGEYRSREAVTEELVKLGRGRNPRNRSLALWQFSHDMQVNDVIIAQYGGRHVVGWGFVRGDYTYDPDRPEYPHMRSVEWHACKSPVTAPHKAVAKALTNFQPYLQFVYQVFAKIGEIVDPPPIINPPPPYTIETALEGLFVSREQFHRILESIRLRKNLILQGPPGTGKTFIAQRIAWCLIGRKDPAQLAMVQFHQSYAYEDFVQGWRPTDKGGFSLKNGVFFRFCQDAREHPDEHYVFIIDEINRGNLSRIFGELLMLIESDKRSAEYAVALTYDGVGTPFFIPPNVYILGMMNTADRSLALVDYALRRRFAFEELIPAFGADVFRDYLQEIGLDLALIKVVNERMDALNEEIRNDNELGRGFQVGHSFFVPGDDDELSDDWFEHVVRTQIRPLLQEYWFDTPERVESAVSRLLAP